MNVTENYMLQQMQNMASAMSAVPQTGNKTQENGSFQDMMDQVGSKNSASETASASKDSKDSKNVGDTKDVKETVKEKDDLEEKAPVQGEEKEELKPEQLTANPNAVNSLELFRPDVVQAADEAVIEVPVDAIAEESVQGPDLALDGQLSQMETGVQADVDTGVSMERQPESFQETMQELPKENETEAVETVEAPETAPERVESSVKPQRNAEDAPEVEVEVEVEVESDDEPKAEVVEIERPVFHDVRSAPVKVGETYETLDTQKPDMEQNLADTIQAAAQSVVQRVEIHLAPQNLGSLTIEMVKDVNGALQVVLHASNSKAMGVLNQHLDGLQAALRNYNQEEVRVQVQHNDESQEQHFKQADPDGRGNQQRQQEKEHHEEHTGDAFMQKLRLGLFGTDEI